MQQEIIDVFHKHEVTKKPYPKAGCAKGVKKYIKKCGKYIENPRFKELKSKPNVIIKTKAVFEI